MKRIINTTENKIEVDILGNHYVLEPMGFLDVPKAVAEYWKGSLHAFLKESDIPVKEVKEVVKEEVKKVTKK